MRQARGFGILVSVGFDSVAVFRCALLYALVLIPERLPNAVTVDAREAARTIEKRQSHRDFLNHLHSGFTWTQFAPFVFKRTMSIGGPTYSGLCSISS